MTDSMLKDVIDACELAVRESNDGRGPYPIVFLERVEDTPVVQAWFAARPEIGQFAVLTRVEPKTH